MPITNADEPAYPVEVAYSGDTLRGQQTGSYSGWATGLTKRELFAAMAMQGLLADGEAMDVTIAQVALAAVQLSDALLAELAKPKDTQ